MGASNDPLAKSLNHLTPIVKPLTKLVLPITWPPIGQSSHFNSFLDSTHYVDYDTCTYFFLTLCFSSKNWVTTLLVAYVCERSSNPVKSAKLTLKLGYYTSYISNVILKRLFLDRSQWAEFSFKTGAQKILPWSGAPKFKAEQKNFVMWYNLL